MARGLKKNMKRLNFPEHSMEDKLGGASAQAPEPSYGRRKSRECLPLIHIMRKRLKYALTYSEVISVLMHHHVHVDGKMLCLCQRSMRISVYFMTPRVDSCCTRSGVRRQSISYKVRRSVQLGKKGIPYIKTCDGRRICCRDPLIKANDTVKLDLESSKIVDFIKFDVGNVAMVTAGSNMGRVGIIKNREKNEGSSETIHIQDATGHEFATRLRNIFTIGKGTKPWVSLPKRTGVVLSV